MNNWLGVTLPVKLKMDGSDGSDGSWETSLGCQKLLQMACLFQGVAEQFLPGYDGISKDPHPKPSKCG